MSRTAKCEQTRLQVVTTGLLFLLCGVAVFAGARGWYDPRDAWAWWPLGFVFPAVHNLVSPPPQRNVFAGLAWIAAAVVLILDGLDIVNLRFTHMIAAALLVVGARMLYIASRGVEAR